MTSAVTVTLFETEWWCFWPRNLDSSRFRKEMNNVYTKQKHQHNEKTGRVKNAERLKCRERAHRLAISPHQLIAAVTSSSKPGCTCLGRTIRHLRTGTSRTSISSSDFHDYEIVARAEPRPYARRYSFEVSQWHRLAFIDRSSSFNPISNSFLDQVQSERPHPTRLNIC